MNVPPVIVLRSFPLTSRLVMLTGAMLFSVSATADYKISAYENTPGFKQIMAADYAAATQATIRVGLATSRFAVTSNRCVAHMQLGNLDAALSSCNSALGEYNAYQTFSYLPGNQRRDKASLLSNRGVVLALKGQMAEAEADFIQALGLNPEHENAAENLEYVRSKMVGGL